MEDIFYKRKIACPFESFTSSETFSDFKVHKTRNNFQQQNNQRQVKKLYPEQMRW